MRGGAYACLVEAQHGSKFSNSTHYFFPSGPRMPCSFCSSSRVSGSFMIDGSTPACPLVITWLGLGLGLGLG